MDILDLVISLLVIGAFYFLNSRKKKEEQPLPGEFDDQLPEENEIPVFEEVEKRPSSRELMKEKMQNASKKENKHAGNHLLFENEENEIEIEFSAEENGQNIENEREYPEDFLFSLDEAKKAVVWSEILKNPYN